MKPAKSLLDPQFHYTSSAATDLRRTFARVRREQRQQAEIAKAAAEQAEREAATNVRPITKRKAAT